MIHLRFRPTSCMYGHRQFCVCIVRRLFLYLLAGISVFSFGIVGYIFVVVLVAKTEVREVS